MKISILGSTGFVGSYLTHFLGKNGHEIIPLGRKDLANKDILKRKIEQSHTLINLAGAPINKKWDEAYKKVLYSSRIDTTLALFEAVKELDRKPKNYFSASAVGIYDPFYDGIQDEENYSYGDNFLSKICIDWEKEALRFKEMDIRVVIFRFGVVLGKGGGALSNLLPIFKWGLGGKIGSGKQGFPWVYIEDLARGFLWALENENTEGVYNLCSPDITTNEKLTKTLASVLKRPAFLRIPEFVIRIILKEGAIAVTTGPKVMPNRLLREGFKFKYPDLKIALEKILA